MRKKEGEYLKKSHKSQYSKGFHQNAQTFALAQFFFQKKKEFMNWVAEMQPAKE